MGICNTLVGLVGAFVVSAIISGAATADDKGDRHRNNGFKGTWVCSAEHGGQGTRPLAWLFDLKLGKSGSVTGIGAITGLAGVASCDVINGSYDSYNRGRISMNAEVTCKVNDTDPFSEPVFLQLLPQKYECSGSGETGAGKYTKMTCLDLKTEIDVVDLKNHDVLTLLSCDRR